MKFSKVKEQTPGIVVLTSAEYLLIIQDELRVGANKTEEEEPVSK